LDDIGSLPIVQLGKSIVELALDVVEDLDMCLDRGSVDVAKPNLCGVDRRHTSRFFGRRHLAKLGRIRRLRHALTVADEPFSRSTD
jgi:hypothetical protein